MFACFAGGVVLAALLGGANLPVGDVVQQALPEDVSPTVLQALPDGMDATLLQALPPPPTTVVRETYFGKVTIDHAAHLRRRARCVTCHGPGRVSKLDFTPKIAHERCVGCHKEQAAGPTQCSGCHVKPPKPSDLPDGIQVRTASAAGATPAASHAPAGPGAAPLATSAALPAPPPPPAVAATRDPGAMEVGALTRIVQVGFSARSGLGPSLRLSSRVGDFAVTHSFDRMGDGDGTRTLGLIGFGVTRPIDRKLRTEVVGLGGFDLVDRPRLAWRPALGARAGLEWSARRWMFHSVQLSVTGVVDLTRNSAGDVDGTVFATIGTGLTLPPRR